MAYTYSKTDWNPADRMTHTEMNRISENINAVFGISLKNNYTQNDILTLAQWDSIREVFSDVEIGEMLSADNINAVELATERAHNGLYPSNTLYPSDELYPR